MHTRRIEETKLYRRRRIEEAKLYASGITTTTPTSKNGSRIYRGSTLGM
jgi:hypothetical protein